MLFQTIQYQTPTSDDTLYFKETSMYETTYFMYIGSENFALRIIDVMFYPCYCQGNNESISFSCDHIVVPRSYMNNSLIIVM